MIEASLQLVAYDESMVEIKNAYDQSVSSSRI